MREAELGPGDNGSPLSWARRGRAMLDRVIDALDAGHTALAELRDMLESGGDDLSRAVIATTALLDAHRATCEFLQMVSAARDDTSRPPAKYRVTCPECGAESITEWTDDLPPGGVSPVECSACGFMILSESEGNPVLIPDAPEPGAAACASSAATFDGRSG